MGDLTLNLILIHTATAVTLLFICASLYYHIQAFRCPNNTVILTNRHIAEHLVLLSFMATAGVAMSIYIHTSGADNFVLLFVTVEAIVTSRITLHLNDEINDGEEFYVSREEKDTGREEDKEER